MNKATKFEMHADKFSYLILCRLIICRDATDTYINSVGGIGFLLP